MGRRLDYSMFCTIADLEEAPDVTATHLAEAVQYRRLDRNLFA